MDGHEFIQKTTGDDMVYPGHPLVLATAIMAVFPDFAAASAPTEHSWCEALADSRIPGAGDHVTGAMDCLAIGAKGGSTAQMIEFARDYWISGRAGGHTRNVDAGTRQAEAIEAKFRELAGAWFVPAGQ